MPEWLKGLAWKAGVRSKGVPRVRIPLSPPVNGHSGPFATVVCEPRQARKGATVTDQLGCRGVAAVVIIIYGKITIVSKQYQVLARKWRPQQFTDMVGQAHVVRALSNALNSKHLHHAYLFTGTRGVGKTTIARILAKCFNCESGVTAQPCGKCSHCQEIDSGRFVDLIEVDAASRTKVEDTRELLDNVQYAPTKGRL